LTRTNAVNFAGALQFPMADAATDIFVKEDVQTLAKAVDQHDHSSGKGLVLPAGAIPTGSITSTHIADGTIDTTDLKDGAVTSAKIADGTIAAADIADKGVTNVKLGADTARANLLTNGGFEIWQRGNGPFAANAAYTADRWLIGLGAGSTISVSRDTANVDSGSQYCAAITYTHSTQTDLSQPVAVDVTPGLRGKTISLSVRVKTTVVNGIRLRANPGSGAVTSAYHTGSGQYETLTLTTGAVAVATTLINFNIEFSVSGTYYLDNAMLVVGSAAADYAPLHPADELARCQRYYDAFSRSNSSNMLAGGFLFSTTGATFTWYWKSTKAVTPTITFSAASTFAIQGSTATATASSITAGSTGVDGTAIIVSSGSGAGAAGGCALLNAASGQTAIVSVEANP
jgi:hypothetical protein